MILMREMMVRHGPGRRRQDLSRIAAKAAHAPGAPARTNQATAVAGGRARVTIRHARKREIMGI
jgi:hypothetical protein